MNTGGKYTETSSAFQFLKIAKNNSFIRPLIWGLLLKIWKSLKDIQVEKIKNKLIDFIPSLPPHTHTSYPSHFLERTLHWVCKVIGII